METYVLILSIVVACISLYIMYSKRTSNKHIEQVESFKLDVKTNEIVNLYVEGMPAQYKDNSRLLKGSGKMHFVEAVEDGSKLVKTEKIIILNSIGERFS